MKRETLGLSLGFVGVLIFGGTLPMTKLTVSAFDPVFVTFARPALAGVLALCVLVFLRRPLPDKAALRSLFLASLALVWGFPGLINFAMVSVPSAHGGVVVGLLPLATSIASALMLRERQPFRFWCVAALGAAVAAGFALRSGGGGLAHGDALLLIAVVLCAAGYVLSGALSRTMPGWEVISWMLVLALPLSLPGMALTLPKDLRAMPAVSLWGFAYVTLLSQYLGFFAWNAGLALGGVARVSQVQLLQTFVTLGFAAILLHERVTPSTWGVAAIVLILVLAAKQSAAQPPAGPGQQNKPGAPPG